MTFNLALIPGVSTNLSAQESTSIKSVFRLGEIGFLSLSHFIFCCFVELYVLIDILEIKLLLVALFANISSV